MCKDLPKIEWLVIETGIPQIGHWDHMVTNVTFGKNPKSFSRKHLRRRFKHRYLTHKTTHPYNKYKQNVLQKEVEER